MIAAEALNWLTAHALPLWSTIGVDRVYGGFVESIGADLIPYFEIKRSRSQARQLYCFVEMERLGLQRELRDIIERGYNFFKHYRSPQGLFSFSVSANGRIYDASCPNYEQAFGLLAMSYVKRALGGEDIELAALETLETVCRERGHPKVGFFEDADEVGAMQSNSHMHLFEAFLAWREISDDRRWVEVSDALGELYVSRAQEAGVICEQYDHQWRPEKNGTSPIVEPGHQFEWATLLLRWGKLTDRNVLPVAEMLYQFAVRYGIDTGRAVAVSKLTPEGLVLDSHARLWPQAEWLKLAVTLAQIAALRRRKFYQADSIVAWHALEGFFSTTQPGLWYDIQESNGNFLEEPARTTSFYHIIGALLELFAYAQTKLTS